tara:strand:- start:673 stop:1407 length:735 start_codon:yes stop_codon:yes gene_type:complete
MIRKNLKWKKTDEGYQFYDGANSVDLKQWNINMNKEVLPSHVINSKNPIIRWEEKRRRNRILKMILNSTPHKIIADVGSANGFIAKQLLPHCEQIYCIDIDQAMLNQAQQTLNSPKANFVQSDAEDIQLDDNTVDVSFAGHLLEHLPSPRKGLSELARITKPNGSIILNLPNERAVLFLKNMLKKLKLTFLLGGDFSEDQAPGHLHVFDKEFLIEHTKGISVINELYLNPPLYTFLYARLTPIK